MGGDQTFDVGAGLLSPAYVESGTTVGGLTYDLMPDIAFQETFDDYIHVLRRRMSADNPTASSDRVAGSGTATIIPLFDTSRPTWGRP